MNKPGLYEFIYVSTYRLRLLLRFLVPLDARLRRVRLLLFLATLTLPELPFWAR